LFKKRSIKVDKGRGFSETEKFASRAGLTTVEGNLPDRGTHALLSTHESPCRALLLHARKHLRSTEFQCVLSP